MKLFAATALAALLAIPAHAMQCTPRGVMVKALTEKYGLTQRSISLADGGGLMEMYANDAGAWRFTLTLPDGSQMCIVSGGHSYEQVAITAPKAPEEPA